MQITLNKIETRLKAIYDTWKIGVAKECSSEYSAMFRMGFPDEFITNEKPLMMYVGQECLNCHQDKTQEWIRRYQTVQLTKQKIVFNNEVLSTNCSPFWHFYRKLSTLGYNVVWNNLDKFHPKDKQRLSKRDSIEINAPYFQNGENLSLLQREIALLNPNVIVLSIGKGKYTASLASALGIDVSLLYDYEPTPDNPIHEISSILHLDACRVFWTYHPAYLQRIRKYPEVISVIKESIK